MNLTKPAENRLARPNRHDFLTIWQSWPENLRYMTYMGPSINYVTHEGEGGGSTEHDSVTRGRGYTATLQKHHLHLMIDAGE